MSRPAKRDHVEEHSLEDVRDIIAEQSWGGDPDDFVPADASVRVVRRKGKYIVVIEWDDK